MRIAHAELCLQLHHLDLQLGALSRELLQELILLGEFNAELVSLHVKRGRLQL